MPKADPEGQVAGTAGADPELPQGPRPRNIQDHRAQARESREDAIERAFGDVPDDDELTVGSPETGASTKEADESEPERKSSSQVREDPRIAALERRIEELSDALEDKVTVERERQEEPDGGFQVEVPEGWDAIKPSFDLTGEEIRSLSKKIEALTEAQMQIRAQTDLANFASRHADFWEISDSIADTAKREGLDLYDYKSLNVAYELVKGRSAMARLREIEKKETVQTEMSKKAGGTPRFRSTQQQVRDEDVAPGNKLLSFDQSWEKGLAKLRKTQRR